MHLKRILSLLLVFIGTLTSQATAPSGYYDSCEGLSGETLLNALHNRIKGHTTVSYNDLWNLYRTSDADENGLLYDIYSTKRWTPGTAANGGEQCGTGTSCVGSCYTREHSFPKSWFGGTVMPMYSDAFHIYPADFYVNNQRNNNPYGECAAGVTKADCNGYSALGKLGSCTFPGYTGTVFEPVDEYKGDLARGYFYMAARYYDVIDQWYLNKDTEMLAHPGNAYPAFSDWALQLLLKWHRQDPVSDKELARQEVVYGAQKNRNPFIDHPELVEYIWGSNADIPWSTTLQVVSEFNQPVAGTVFDCGTVVIGDTYTTTIPLVGTNLTDDVIIAIDNRPTSLDEDVVIVIPQAEEEFDHESFVWTMPEELSPAQTVDGQSKTIDGVTFTSGKVIVKNDKKDAGTAPRLYKTNDVVTLRPYAGSTTTFISNAGNIRRIEFGSPDKAMYGVATSDTGEVSANGLEWNGDARIVTITWAKFAKTPGGNQDQSPKISYFTVYTNPEGSDASFKTYTDLLTAESPFGIKSASGSGYDTFTADGATTGRTYVAQANKRQSFFQFRSNNSNSGLVSTTQGSTPGANTLMSVKIKWAENTGNAGRKLDLYASNTKYTAPSDLYSTSTRGTLVGSFTYDPENLEQTIDLTGLAVTYDYVGMRSNSGAIYIDNIDIEWKGEVVFDGYKDIATWLRKQPAASTPILEPIMVLYQNGEWMWVTDTYSVLLIRGEVGQTYQPGDIIPQGFSGTYSLFNDEMPLMVPDTATFLPATEMSENILKSEYIEFGELNRDMVNRFLNFDEVVVTKQSNKVFFATDADGRVLRLYNQFSLPEMEACDDAEIEGFLSIYNGEFQFIPTSFDPNPTREFNNVERTIDASTANASTEINVDFTPTKAGKFYATLTLKSGSLQNVVQLVGTGVAGMTALEATNITPESFTANWVDADGGNSQYRLYVCADGNVIDGYPVLVDSSALEYTVEDLDDNTEYSYYLVCATHGNRSNTMTVTTAEYTPEIQVRILGSQSGNTNYIQGEDTSLRIQTKPGFVYDVATIGIDVFHIDGIMEIEIDAPFEVSEDNTNWEHVITVDSRLGQIYLRLRSDELGIFRAPLLVKAGPMVENGSDSRAKAPSGYTSWRVINDDLNVYGEVKEHVTGVDAVKHRTDWEAYCLDGKLVLDNRTDAPVEIGVYTIDGITLGIYDVKPGTLALPLPAGLYLIATDTDSRRVVVH